MPTWGQILNELNASKPEPRARSDFDGVRRKYLRALHDRTKRAVILYASAFLESKPASPTDLQIHLIDIQGLMEVVSSIQQRELDLIIHSGGGSAEAAEAVVAYLRQRFDHIRVFVPLAAMSAATMLTLAADEIVMGQHSQLGPIDPQFTVLTPEGPRSAPAQAILDQFELAKSECQEASNLAAWMPILRGYAPGLLVQCRDSRRLSEQMVFEWLQSYMFAGEADAEMKARRIASWFADYQNFRSHGRRVGADEARNIGLKVTRLEDDQGLQDAVLSIHHATMHTFSGTGATKIIENHDGRAFIRLVREIAIPVPAVPVPSGAEPPRPSRAERRRQAKERR